VTPLKKLQRFELVADSNSENSWEIPEEMRDYTHKYMNLHLQNRDIKEKILEEHPIPTNLKPIQELDSHIKEILSENHKSRSSRMTKDLKQC